MCGLTLVGKRTNEKAPHLSSVRAWVGGLVERIPLRGSSGELSVASELEAELQAE